MARLRMTNIEPGHWATSALDTSILKQRMVLGRFCCPCFLLMWVVSSQNAIAKSWLGAWSAEIAEVEVEPWTKHMKIQGDFCQLGVAENM